VVLIALSVRGTMTAIRRHRTSREGTPARQAASGAARSYLGLWLMTMTNPLTIVYFVALVLGRPNAAGSAGADQAVFVLAVFIASASWQLALAGSGAVLRRVLTGSRGQLITAIAASALIGGLALHLLIAAW
jgi:threonine/homoserine/homoserine lactone efflux protein